MKMNKLGYREDIGQTEMPKLGAEAALGLWSSCWMITFGQPALCGTWKSGCVVKQILRFMLSGRYGDKHTKKESGPYGS